MILAIDIGNTSTTIGLFDEKGRLEFLSELEIALGENGEQISCELVVEFTCAGAERHHF